MGYRMRGPVLRDLHFGYWDEQPWEGLPYGSRIERILGESRNKEIEYYCEPMKEAEDKFVERGEGKVVELELK